MIVKTAQGRFRVRVKDRGVVVADRTFARWNDAQAWEADRKRQVAAGRLAPASAGRTPLADVYAAWACIRPAQVQPRTWQSDQSAWATHIQPRFGRAPVGSITTLAVHDFAADLRAAHTLGTVQRVIASLIALMEFAVDHHYIETNPARIRLNLHPDTRRHYVTLDPRELMAVWAMQRKDSRYADVTLFLALTGLRWAEFTALRPCDIHATAAGGPMAHIGRSIVRARGEGPPLVTSTKTRADRMVPLPRLAAGIADAGHVARTTGPCWSPGPTADRCAGPPSAGRSTGLRPPRAGSGSTTCGTAAPRTCSRTARTSSASKGSSATPPPPPPCATTATSPETSTYAPPWTTTRPPWPSGTCLRTSTRTRSPAGVGSRPPGPTRGRERPRNSTPKPARRAETTSNSNGLHLGPPRGFEPRAHALRDCTHAWIRLYDLLPINEFRDTE